MQIHRLTLTAFAFLCLAAPLTAQVPNLVSYQGRVAVGTVNFQGTGQFKFALVNAAGTTAYWRNSPDTAPADGVPDAAVSLAVTKGLYSVLLGDPALANMAAIPASVWSNADVRLRIWFNDGIAGFQLLTPDQRLSPAGYLPDGVVSSASLADGSVSSAKIAAGAVIPPQAIAGSSQTAATNTSYVATGVSFPTVFTLPTTAAVGDVVQLSGAGAAGWAAISGIGHQILVPWKVRGSSRYWQALASSADGRDLVAAESSGRLYTSGDYGETWVPRAANREWMALASSYNGTKLAAVVTNGQIYTSTDSGVAWTARESSRAWRAIASSSDGPKLVAAAQSGQLYTSTDSGATWTARDSSRSWKAVASSSDGVKLVAVVGTTPGQIYTSTNSGVTWTPRESNRNWSSVASSSDGSKLVAVEDAGRIYTSTDSGLTWTGRASTRQWWSVASSGDGTRLAAVPFDGNIYTSTDSGVTWAPRESSRNWSAIASSLDGSRLAAAAHNGQIYLFNTRISGAQGTTATMQYLGNGLWSPLAQTQIAASPPQYFEVQGGLDVRGNLIVDGATNLKGSVVMGGPVHHNDLEIYFRGGTDIFHGLGYYGDDFDDSTKAFATIEDIDGPVLYGFGGGVLGSTSGGQRVALRWDSEGRIGIGTASPDGGMLDLEGDLRINNKELYLREGTDPAHGLGYYGTLPGAVDKFFAGTNPDGPVLYGWNGGALGSIGTGQKVVLRWDNQGRVGIGLFPATNKLEVEGNASKTTAGDWLANSDRRIKTGIRPVTGALATLEKVRPVTFRYTPEYRAAHPNIADVEYYNVIAQEFREVFPDAVKSSGEKLPDGSEILQVDTYPATITALAAINELHAKHEAALKHIATLEQRLAAVEKALGAPPSSSGPHNQALILRRP